MRFTSLINGGPVGDVEQAFVVLELLDYFREHLPVIAKKLKKKGVLESMPESLDFPTS